MGGRLIGMRQPLVTIADGALLLAPAIDYLRSRDVRVCVLPTGTSALEAAELSRGSIAVIVHELPMPRDTIERLAGTLLIVRAGAGYNTVDVAAAAEHGVWVANVPDYCTDEVADHTLMLLLAISRRLRAMESLARSDPWTYRETLPEVHRIRGHRLGIVGLGAIGREVARRALAFDWEVVAADPRAEDPNFEAPVGVQIVGLDELFTSSDAITLHCPLTRETLRLVNVERLNSMRRGAIIINTSRGALVDLSAVKGALGEGRLGGLGLDVADGEPSPELDSSLTSHPGVVVTPHLAWYSIESRRDLAIHAAEEALRVIRGEPPRHAVNIPVSASGQR